MAAEMEEVALTKRRLIVRDSLSFLSLILITVALFGVTLFLFRSFMTHRVELAARWADRGRLALAQGRADEAVVAFRTALSYAPDEHADELLLARALGEAGRTEESYNYFMELWSSGRGMARSICSLLGWRPGSGRCRTRLIRIARRSMGRGRAMGWSGGAR